MLPHTYHQKLLGGGNDETTSFLKSTYTMTLKIYMKGFAR